MQIAVLTDVHANLAALEAVLRHAERERAVDQVWVLGDLVGYGAEPSECLTLLQRYRLLAVAGNHDLAAIGRLDTSQFNAEAAEASRWTATRLSAADRSFLEGLPETLLQPPITLVHGSLRLPVWEYIVDEESANAQFDRQATPYSFVGHTHLPVVFEEVPGRRRPIIWPLSHGDVLTLGERRLIVNPGGVGQPRDGDPRAAYAVYDTDDRTVALHRVPYDIERTQRVMTRAGLPERLIQRLSYGR